MLFWSVYEQGGSSMTIFADRLTKNELFGIEFPSSWYQSLSASYVVFLAPVFSWLWIKLGRKQPSSPAKFTWGLSLLGLGTFLMVPACVLAATGKVSPFWLCSVYLIQVLGELCLSPVGLSTVTKLAPKRFLSFTMGIWFLAASLGNWLAGFFASLFDESNMASMVYLFGAMSAMILVAAGILFILTPKVRKLMAGVQ
jgi:POT family proton-dependent oligopeptide transporter